MLTSLSLEGDESAGADVRDYANEAETEHETFFTLNILFGTAFKWILSESDSRTKQDRFEENPLSSGFPVATDGRLAWTCI